MSDCTYCAPALLLRILRILSSSPSPFPFLWGIFMRRRRGVPIFWVGLTTYLPCPTQANGEWVDHGAAHTQYIFYLLFTNPTPEWVERRLFFRPPPSQCPVLPLTLILTRTRTPTVRVWVSSVLLFLDSGDGSSVKWVGNYLPYLLVVCWLPPVLIWLVRTQGYGGCL
jgi:hypothetical protein